MRLLLVLVLAAFLTATAHAQQLPAFFMRAPAPVERIPNTMRFDLFETRCERVLEPAIVAAQIFDLFNTNAQFRRYPLSRETDWWTAMFAGSSGRSLTGVAVGIALNDFIKWKLTERSKPLRCLVEMNQFTTTIEAIGITHPR